MKKVLLTIIMLFIFPLMPANAAISDYLILNDIGAFKPDEPVSFFEGRPPTGGPRVIESAGALAGAYHFKDHTDKTYIIMHIDKSRVKPSPEVEVTQHAGVDSDKWLLHEIEDAYRSSTVERMGLISQGTRIREINGNKVIGMRGSGYTWVCNNVVIDVSYTDLQGTKPEPLEVVQAYLTKFPSTITATPAEFKSTAYNTKWIKDEMERRLWLCDKWLMQLQLGKVNQTDTLKALVKHMTVFLNYRQKYYSMAATEDLSVLYTALQTNDGTTIKNKLTAYKAWWNANKTKSISL